MRNQAGQKGSSYEARETLASGDVLSFSTLERDS